MTEYERKFDPIMSATSFRHLGEIVHALEPEAGWRIRATIGPRQTMMRGDDVWAEGTFEELKAKLAAHYRQA